MATTSFDFSVPADFTLTNISISSLIASLSLDTPNPLTKTSDFGTPSDYTYDNTKIVVASNMAALVNSGAVQTTFYASLASSQNADYAAGAPTGTLSGGATISAGYLNIVGNGPYATWPGAQNVTGLVQTGCVRCIFNPGYSGTPSDFQVFYESEQDGTLNNLVQMRHSPDGNITCYVYDSSGNPIALAQAIFNPVAGTDYEFEVDFDVTAGLINLFQDGVIIATSSGTGTRSGSATLITVGRNAGDGTTNANFRVKGIAIFPTVQHTANYSAPSPAPAIQNYSTSNPTIALSPGQAITNPTLSAITNITATIVATGSDSVTFVVSVNGGSSYLYWNGSTWATSSGFAQSNPIATIVANLAFLPLGTMFQIQAYLHSATGVTTPTLANVVVSYNDLIYSTGTIKTNSTFTAENLLTFLSTFSEAGSDTVLFGLVINSTTMYWNGTTWVASDGTAAQLNTLAQIQTNLSTTLTMNSNVGVFVRLTSADGTTTPNITNFSVSYNFGPIEPTKPSLCDVYGFLLDLQSNPIVGAKVKFTLNPKVNPGGYITDSMTLVGQSQVTATTDSNGYFQVSVAQSPQWTGPQPTMAVEVDYTNVLGNIVINKNSTNKPLVIAVPAAATANITGLLT